LLSRLTLLLICYCTLQLHAQTSERYTFVSPKMGTEFRIVLYASDSSQAVQAARHAFRRIDTLNQMLSDYQNDSELNQLSATAGSGEKVNVSNDLWTVLATAETIAKASKGAFDVSIGPLTKLWRRAFRRQQFPEAEKIEAAQKRVRYKWIKLYEKSQQVKLKKPNMRLDLGGIAKGYAVDEAAKVLQSYGLRQILVDGGGDLYAGAAPPDADGWTVERQAVQDGEVVSEVFVVENQAIATSGDTYRFLEWDGQRYSHIINPRTGLGLTNCREVTVVAENCMLADALASTLSVMEIEKARKLLKDFSATATIIEHDNDKVNLLDFE